MRVRLFAPRQRGPWIVNRPLMGVPVPDLVNRLPNDATTVANAIGLTVRVDDQRRPDPKVPAGRVPLQIEATVAFGTGHHGTTLGCLKAFDRLLTAGWRPTKVADIGCGTAVLAMAAAATLPDAQVIASDDRRFRFTWTYRGLRLSLAGFAQLPPKDTSKEAR